MSKFSRGNNRAAKVDAEQVFEIRRRYAEGATQGELAREFGLSINTIGKMVRGETHQRVPMPEETSSPEEILQRLLKAQQERGAGVLEKVTSAAQKVYDKAIKPEREIDRLANWDEAGKFGATKGDSE